MPGFVSIYIFSCLVYMKKLRALLITFLFSSATSLFGAPALDLAQDSINSFDGKLYQALCNKEGNVNYSAISIYSVLYALQKGAQGTTKDQISKALNIEASDDFENQIKSVITGTQNMTNSLWYKEALAIKPDYNQFIKDYDFTIKPVNFYKAEAVKTEINSYIAQKTEKLIENFLTDPLPDDTRLVLLNTLYFHQKWRSEFDERATRQEDFFKTKTDSKKVDMMHKTAYYSYYQNADVQVLELPYEDKRYSMVVILPREYEYDFSKLKLEATLDDYKDKKASKRVQLSFPKFDITSGYDLIPVLKEMGMTNAFNPDAADFSNVFTSPQSIYVDAVVHKVRILVNERETKAAAVTMASSRASAAMPEDPVIFKADHPFLYVIRDNELGINLFTGIVREPK